MMLTCFSSAALQGLFGFSSAHLFFILISPSHNLCSGIYIFFLVAIQRICNPQRPKHQQCCWQLISLLPQYKSSKANLYHNEVLSTAAKRRGLLHNPGHWSLWPILVDFLATTTNMMHSIIKIGRDTNRVGDNFIKKERKTSFHSWLLLALL